MPDAAYYRAWRAAHPEYRKRQTKLKARKRAERGRESRVKETANRRSRTRIDMSPLPQLYEKLRHGAVLSFWEDELKMDLAQERALAEAERFDADEAVRSYRARELAWRGVTKPLLIPSEVYDDH